MTSTVPSANLGARIAAVHARIAAACDRSGRNPAGVTLVAVTKTMPASAVLEAYEAGLRDLGENRVQEGIAKVAAVAETLGSRHSELGRPSWHLIGHLQTNKVRAAIDAFAILHAVDSERLLRAIDTAASKPVSVMLEVNVSGEASKFGLAPEDVPSAVVLARSLPGLQLLGLMTVAPHLEDAAAVRPVFRQLASLAHRHDLPNLSMGMTDDFEVAIEEGATHVRVGRALFGERA